MIRDLTDAELVVSQGIENSAREDLSFIERAIFAFSLEEAGFERSTVQQALSIDRAEASKLLSVAKSVPAEVFRFIGRAPKVGRGRWLTLAEALQKPNAAKRTISGIRSQRRGSETSEVRFLAVLSMAQATTEENKVSTKSSTVRTSSGGRDCSRRNRQARDKNQSQT